MYKRKFKKITKFLFLLYFNHLVKAYSHYHPIIRSGKITGARDRNCEDRWQLIKAEIKKYGVKSVVDIGCAEGFYVLHSAKELECFSLGIDADIRRLVVAQNQIVSEGIMPVGFMFGVIDEKLLNKIPKFDMVIFMSVMHHMMCVFGEDYCRGFLIKLRKKIGKVMIFEMGQSNETKNEWASQLPDMGSNPHEWIKNFLLSAGFSSVVKIDESDSYQKDQNRAIFKVEP